MVSLLPHKNFTSFQSFSANTVCFGFGPTNHITGFHIDSFGYFPDCCSHLHSSAALMPYGNAKRYHLPRYSGEILYSQPGAHDPEPPYTLYA